MRRWLLPVTAVPIIVLDQLTKFVVRASMTPGESVPVIWRLQWTYVQNTGSAFGLFLDQRVLLSVVGAAGVIAILLFYRFLSPPSRLALVAMSLVLAGAISNLIDRFFLGYVTDFIDVHLWGDFHWPFFNVADSAITTGSLILIYFLVFVVRKVERSREKRQA